MEIWSECSKKEKIERWRNMKRVLRNLTPHQKKEHFRMETWGRHTECGTVACAGGFCSLDPWFQARGLVGEIKEEGFLTRLVVNGRMEDIYKSMICFFGYTGSSEILGYAKQRSVTTVMKEISAYIRRLKDSEDIPHG